MLNGIRVVSVEKGNDPRDFSLLSFGGAGACHATAIMERLEIDRVIIPPTAAAFSAFGLLCTDLRRDFVSTVYKTISEVKTKELHKTFRSMEKQSNNSFSENVSNNLKLKFEYSADLRYRGQGSDLRVSLPGPANSLTPSKISKLFGQEYERTYGYLEDEANIQLINLRVVASLITKKPIVKKSKTSTKLILKSARKEKREVYFTEFGKFVSTTIFDGHKLRPGNLMKGPAIIELKTTTIVLRPEQKLRVDLYGNFIVARTGVKP
jgi:N-methylhydantoinase A